MKNKISAFLFFLLPLAYLAPPCIRIGGIRFNWYEIVFYMALCLGPIRKGNGLVLLVLLLDLVVIGTNIFSVVAGESALSLHDFSLIKYSVCYIGAIHLGLYLPEHIFSRKNALAIFLFVLFISMAVASIYSNEIRDFIRQLYGIESATKNIRLRMIGANPIVLSTTTMILYFLASRGRSFVVRLILFALGILPILYARQRAGMFLYPMLFFVSEFGLTFMSIFSLHKSKIKYIVLCLIVFSLCWFGVKENEVIKKRAQLFSFQKNMHGVNKRLDVFKLALEGIAEKPFLGHGYQSIRGRNYGGVVHAHNTYLQLWAEHGLLGVSLLLGFVCFLISQLKLLYYYTARCSGEREIEAKKKIFTAFIIVYLVSMFGWQMFYMVNYSSLWFFVFGFMVADIDRMRLRNKAMLSFCRAHSKFCL